MSKTETAVNPAQSNGSVANVAPQKNITEVVLARVMQFQQLGELRIPENYSPENALKSAYLILSEQVDSQNRPVLTSCSKESIANSLLNMVVQGLSPMKKQGAFIAYNGKLSWQTEYHGNIALAKRYGGVKDVSANIIYEGDVFEYAINPKTGRKEIIKHEQKFENVDNNKIKGAYATLILSDDSAFVEIMNMAQIRLAWNQGAAKGNSPAHRNFPDQMAAKTVISRACKLFVSTSDDSSIMPDDTEIEVNTAAEVVSSKANRQTITMDEVNPEPEDVIEKASSTEPMASTETATDTDKATVDPNIEPKSELDF